MKYGLFLLLSLFTYGLFGGRASAQAPAVKKYCNLDWGRVELHCHGNSNSKKIQTRLQKAMFDCWNHGGAHSQRNCAAEVCDAASEEGLEVVSVLANGDILFSYY